MRSLFLSFFILISVGLFAQDKYFTKAGRFQFDATTAKSPEKIVGVTNSAICVLDTKTGNIQLSVVLKSYEFANALMQEHFNENYVESNTYPKSDFKGLIVNNSAVNYAKDGSYPVTVKGTLNLHGITKEVESAGKITIQHGKILATSTFSVKLSDYNIKIPGIVSDKVAEMAKIIIDCSLEPLKK